MKRALATITIALAAACGGSNAPDGDDSGDDGAGTPDASPTDDDASTSTCDGIPETGTCTSATELSRCVDGTVVTETCAAACVTDGAGAHCVGAEACAGVGPLGRCDGDTLTRCDDAAPVITDCTAAGETCAYTDDTIGYACVAPASVGAHRVAGVMTWQDRALTPGNLAAPVTMPARGTMVAVIDDATDELIAQVSSADDGSYVAHYDATGTVRVAVYSRSRSTKRPARVRDTAGYLHAVGSTPFAAGSQATVDIAVTAATTAGPAWNVLDNAVTAMDWLRAHGVATMSPVYMYWQQSTASGSYYQGGNNELHLDGGDGWDDVVALHELGHYMQDEYSASDNPGGPHNGSPADPRLAWGEGGATWFAIAIRNAPHYIDYSPGGGWSVELENNVHEASATGSMSQYISEWMVAEVMFDMTDGPAGDGDPVDGNAGAVFDVLVGYLVSPGLQPRGFAGVDLVEFLDGWFEHHGTGSCAAMRTLLDEQYRFPYDFLPCP